MRTKILILLILAGIVAILIFDFQRSTKPSYSINLDMDAIAAAQAAAMIACGGDVTFHTPYTRTNETGEIGVGFYIKKDGEESIAYFVLDKDFQVLSARYQVGK